MSETLPAPMTPADCDLRGFDFMPLMGDRLFKSATWIAGSAESKVAMLRLWWHAYSHEVPAASLPDDDVLLADYAGYGVAVKAWKRIKQQAMRGFVLCSDGRWYHPVVAELALAGWKERQRNREKQRAWRERNQQNNQTVTVTQPVTLPANNAGEGRGERGQERVIKGIPLNLSPDDGVGGTARIALVPPPPPPPVPSDPPTPPPPFCGTNEADIPARAIVPLATTFELPEPWGNDAERLGFQPAEILREAEKFRQFFVAGKGSGTRRGVKGWRQSWSNWLGKAATDNRRTA